MVPILQSEKQKEGTSNFSQNVANQHLKTHTDTHTPMNTGGLSEQGGVPAQVDDIIVLTKVLPCDPENTWRATSGKMCVTTSNGNKTQHIMEHY